MVMSWKKATIFFSCSLQGEKKGTDQELIQSNPTLHPQNQNLVSAVDAKSLFVQGRYLHVSISQMNKIIRIHVKAT